MAMIDNSLFYLHVYTFADEGDLAVPPTANGSNRNISESIIKIEKVRTRHYF
jgi:hypothetical protein